MRSSAFRCGLGERRPRWRGATCPSRRRPPRTRARTRGTSWRGGLVQEPAVSGRARGGVAQAPRRYGGLGARRRTGSCRQGAARKKIGPSSSALCTGRETEPSITRFPVPGCSRTGGMQSSGNARLPGWTRSGRSSPCPRSHVELQEPRSASPLELGAGWPHARLPPLGSAQCAPRPTRLHQRS